MASTAAPAPDRAPPSPGTPAHPRGPGRDAASGATPTPLSLLLDLALLALVVGVAAWTRAQFLAVGAPLFVTPDSDDYLGPAYDLAHGLGFDPELRRTPLYPFFVAAVLAAGGDLVTLAVAQHVLGVLTAAAAFGLGRVTYGRWTGLIAGLAAALSGPLLIYEHYLMAESLFTLVLTVAVLILVVALRGRGRAWLFAAGAAVGLAVLTRPVGQVAVPVALGLPVLLAYPRWRDGARRAGLVGLGLLIVLLPWMVRNWAVHGTFGAEGALGQALIGRTVRHDRGFVYDDPRRPDPDPTRAAARRIIGEEVAGGEPSGGTITARVRDELGLSQARTSSLLRELAIDAIRQRPGPYLASTVETTWALFQGKNERLLGHWRQRTTRNWDRRWDPRLVPLLGDELPASGPAYERADELTSTFQPWRWRRPIAWLFGLGVVLAFVARRWRLGLVPAITAIVLVVAAAALDGLVWRFRYPADPLIAVVAAGGLTSSATLVGDAARRLASKTRGLVT
jgi:4-amino-4-deoxy-L-arabinose transferase-like glycosyltransferase